MGIASEVGHNIIVMVLTILVVIIVIVLIIVLLGYWLLPKVSIGNIYLIDFIK